MKEKEKSIVYGKKEIDAATYNRLKAQLKGLKDQLKDIRSQLDVIRSNDGSNMAESASFLFLIAQEAGKCNEIAELEEKINGFVVVDKNNKSDIIGLGDKVTVEMIYSDSPDKITTVTYLLVGSLPDIDNNIISQDSAIGKFIIGKSIGTSGEIFLPNGRTASIKIISKE